MHEEAIRYSYRYRLHSVLKRLRREEKEIQ